jgi:hypothetical protein
MKWVFLLLGILTLGASVGLAQIITGSIVGQVTDPSGAVIPSVQVTVTNQGTGISVQRSADASGAYSIPDLQAGIYDVTVTKTGFRTYHGTGVQLLASQSVRVDVKLEVGNVQQQVTVTAQAPLVNTEGAEIRGSASVRQIMDLPLAQQSIDGLMILVPGAQNMGSSPQIGGATHWGGSNFTINGIQANDFGNGAAAYSYGTGLLSLPALDSLQEFKIDAYSMNAEYRNVATVTMVTKAGGNQFHGQLYEYNENAALNANTFLNNAAGRVRPPAVRNQFAGNVGGPILKNKLFFFADYTGFRNRQYSAVQLNLPTMQMRQGNFSAYATQLYNPFTGAAFGGNQVDSTLITAQAKTLMTYLPAPTSNFTGAGLPNAAYDYYGLVSTAQDMNEVDVRVDYHLSDKDSIYGVYTRNIASPYSWALGGPPQYGNASSFGYKTYGYSLVETHTFNPHALNDLRLAWFNHPNIRSGINLDFNPQSLFPQLTTSPNRGLPSMNLTAGGYPTMFNDYGKGYYGQAPDGELTDNFTYIHGHHTIKAGTDIAGYKTYGPSPNASLGAFTFSGQWTGNKGWPALGL